MVVGRRAAEVAEVAVAVEFNADGCDIVGEGSGGDDTAERGESEGGPGHSPAWFRQYL